MNNAADEDLKANDAKFPVVTKLKMMPEAMETSRKGSLAQSIFDINLLEALASYTVAPSATGGMFGRNQSVNVYIEREDQELDKEGHCEFIRTLELVKSARIDSLGLGNICVPFVF
ncbi:hypothetical protein K438DRAFT_1777105 [Mycena galopus ATCC 62051]|nr:hypothetical protein K438DRAFT_1777105 [Mycena galopus ATCC 62051]